MGHFEWRGLCVSCSGALSRNLSHCACSLHRDAVVRIGASCVGNSHRECSERAASKCSESNHANIADCNWCICRRCFRSQDKHSTPCRRIKCIDRRLHRVKRFLRPGLCCLIKSFRLTKEVQSLSFDREQRHLCELLVRSTASL